MKKRILVPFLLLLTINLFALETQFRLMPFYNIPLNSSFEGGFNVNASFDFLPFTIRQRDNIYFSVQGGNTVLKASSINNYNILNAAFAAGYELRIIDRLSVSAEGYAGLWMLNVPENDSMITDGKTASEYSESGLNFGGRLFANYYILPELSIGAFVGFNSFSYQPEAIMNSVQAGINIRYNFTKGLFARSGIQTVQYDVSPLFPVFYSYYDDHSFGTISFINSEKNKIQNVSVSVFIEKYMANPTVVQTFDELDIGEEFTVDMTAFLNESMLNEIMVSKADVKVIVAYSSLGKKMQYEESIELQTLSRNNMSWEEDERAAAFVSGKDASANKFARLVQIVLDDKIDKTKNINVQYARGLFAALKAYGLNYVVDPASAFTDNAGSAAIDFLQFPYQTLLYHGGDCDDLTILNCSLLEALNIQTAFITVPGHIYMAFDAGISPNDVTILGDKYYIIKDGVVWIPVEITLCQQNFDKAKAYGYSEWVNAGSEAALIPVHKAWDMYNPISIPDSDVNFELPSRDKILRNY